MAELRLISLQDVLTERQMHKLVAELEELKAAPLPAGDEEAEMEELVNDDTFAEFVDRLEANDLACDIYLPMEFDGVVEVGDHTVGSAVALAEVLEDLREELDIDEEGSDDDEEEMDIEMIEEQLRMVWRSFLKAANTAIERQMPFQVIS